MPRETRAYVAAIAARLGPSWPDLAAAEPPLPSAQLVSAADAETPMPNTPTVATATAIPDAEVRDLSGLAPLSTGLFVDLAAHRGQP